MAQDGVLRARFGGRVRALLAEQELGSEGLAKLTGLRIARIEKILVGELVRITLADMTLVADALGVPLYGLLSPVLSPASIVAGQEIEKG